MSVVSVGDREEILRAHYASTLMGVENVNQREFYMRYRGHTRDYAQRHMSFPNLKFLRKSLVQKPPLHLYHSTSYYIDPAYRDNTMGGAEEKVECPHCGFMQDTTLHGNNCRTCGVEVQEAKAPSMARKGWLGADLLFDIDLDHFPNIKSYEHGLEMASDNAIRLIDDFLINDFNIAEESMSLRFSGHRGFHVLVSGDDYERMSKEERQPIEDYILGTEVHASGFLFTSMQGKSSLVKRDYQVYDAKESGWGGRFTRTLNSMLTALNKAPSNEKRVDMLKEWAPRIKAGLFYQRPEWTEEPTLLKPKVVKAIISFATDDECMKGLNRDGRLSYWMGRSGATKAEIHKLVGIAVEKCQLDRGVQIDRIVSDTTRQVRACNSIHSKKFLPCIEIERQDLNNIESIYEKIADFVGTESTTIELSQPAIWEVTGEEFEAGLHELPRWKAHSVVFGSQPLTKKKETATVPQ